MPEDAAAFRLHARLPSGEELEVPVEPGTPVVIGRALDCPLVLNGDGRASRHHAAVELRGAEVWVRDLGSRNGTLVNGERVVESRIEPGDELVVGGSRMRVLATAGAPALAEIVVCCSCSRALPLSPAEAGPEPRCERCTAAGPSAPQGPQLPGFTFERRLGAGAMGDVWLAQDQRHERVAVKLLAPPKGARPVAGALARFVREARALRALCHPGIVMLLEAGVADDLHYIVMEYVRGEDYDHLLQREKRLPLGQVCRLVLEMCDALAHAHGKGIVHRDIKPGNILRSAAAGPDGLPGHIKLTDFGLARLAQQTGLSVQSMSSAGIGSPLYMPPEQILAIHKADHRADVYALAATAFHLAAGRPVFQAPSVAEIVAKVLDDPAPSLAGVLPEAPAILSQAFAWALEKDPERRYQSAEEMAQGFRSAMRASGITTA